MMRFIRQSNARVSNRQAQGKITVFYSSAIGQNDPGMLSLFSFPTQPNLSIS